VDVPLDRYRYGPDEIEVSVADNASTDGTGNLARSRGCRVTRVERRAIGSARNGGTRLASGAVLGVVVCRRQDFEAIGGHREEMLFAEDFAFLLARRQYARPMRQRLVRLRHARRLPPHNSPTSSASGTTSA
jgi:glycosyltransferase involved in cell wall biosynthesis